MATITLEKRGCDFWNDDQNSKLSDVGNYRVGIYDYSIHCINGRNYILEFSQGTRYHYRTTNKRTGKPLKHGIMELINPNSLHLGTEFERLEPNGFKSSWRDSKLEEVIYNMNLSYTKADILRVINMISETKFDSIKIK